MPFGLGQLTLAIIVARAIVLLVAFPAHEGAHALVADRLGDPTPRRAGRLTLNPIPHLDLVGSLLFLAAGIGWAYTPVDPWRLGRRGMALMALAGPVANLLVALLFALPARVVSAQPDLYNLLGVRLLFPPVGAILESMVVYNLVLFVFNLIPLPPLDGFRILLGVLPYGAAQSFQKLERYGSLLLLAVIFLLPALGLNIIGPIIGLPFRTLAGLLLGR
jgi:Zn-dependent protease